MLTGFRERLYRLWHWREYRPIRIPEGAYAPGVQVGVMQGDAWNRDWKHCINAIRQRTGLSFEQAMQFRVLFDLTSVCARLDGIAQILLRQQQISENPFASVEKVVDAK